MNVNLFYAIERKIKEAEEEYMKAKEMGNKELEIKAETKMHTWNEARSLLYLV